jgi:hypothetical protein
MSSASAILEQIKNSKKQQNSENVLNYLQKLNKNLNSNNIVTLAYLANNPLVSEKERAIFLECLREKTRQEFELYSQEIERVEGTKGSL